MTLFWHVMIENFEKSAFVSDWGVFFRGVHQSFWGSVAFIIALFLFACLIQGTTKINPFDLLSGKASRTEHKTTAQKPGK